eukprot:984004-Rhodomonas_salina.1
MCARLPPRKPLVTIAVTYMGSGRASVIQCDDIVSGARHADSESRLLESYVLVAGTPVITSEYARLEISGSVLRRGLPTAEPTKPGVHSHLPWSRLHSAFWAQSSLQPGVVWDSGAPCGVVGPGCTQTRGGRTLQPVSQVRVVVIPSVPGRMTPAEWKSVPV